MEVKSIYLDLQKAELTKKGKKSVWKLESEAFKEPLELKIGYEDKELEQFHNELEELKKYADNKFALIEKHENLCEHVWACYKTNVKRCQDIQHSLDDTNYNLSQFKSEFNSLYLKVSDLITMIETQSGTILKLQDKVRELEKKVTKQPMVYSDKTFISGHERCGLSMIEIPSGEYLVISKYEIWECNEFVTNRNDIVMEKITVNDNCYIPMYQLVGWTDLDTPTATIYWTLTFIPC